jgi:hypothetical protein
MPNLNIKALNAGDTQESIREKVNSNFDSVVAAGGGPQGQQGDQGKQGPIGPAGPKGDPGQEGIRGTKWFVQGAEPIGGPSDPIRVGDYWVQTLSNNSIYEYTDSGWIDTGQNLKASEVFEVVSGISGPTGGKDAIVISSPFPELNTLVISDSAAATSTINPTYAKFLISSNGSNDYPILEFSKTNVGGIGTPADYNRHPQFRWLDPSGSNYDLLFSVPQDDFTVTSGGSMLLQSTSSTLNISGNGGLNITSGSQMTFTSTGAMSFSSGTSLMTFSSQKFNLTSSLLALNVPMTISGVTSQSPLLSLLSSGSGDTLKIQSTSSSSSYYLLRLLSANTERFSVRNDGKVTFQRQVNATNNTASSTPSDDGPTGTGRSLTSTLSPLGVDCDLWCYGPVSGTHSSFVTIYDFGPGNNMYANWTTSNKRVIYVDNVNNNPTNWGEWLSNNESITLVYYAASGKLFNGITYFAGSPPSSFTEFSTSASRVEVTHMNVGSTYKCYWSTCAGECGVLF